MNNTDLPKSWRYNHVREELYCPHGIGHPVPWSEKETHGCDGCCSSSPTEENDEWDKAVQIIRRNLESMSETSTEDGEN